MARAQKPLRPPMERSLVALESRGVSKAKSSSSFVDVGGDGRRLEHQIRQKHDQDQDIHLRWHCVGRPPQH